MQKIINVLAVTSFAVSLAVVSTAGYVYVRKDAIIDSIKEKALKNIGGAALGGLAGGGLGGALVPGLPSPAPSAPSAGLPGLPGGF
tara:strand:+ start:4904 stop:5161 length:258 start_codon:yes stop_codon:yes gene_type:complete